MNFAARLCLDSCKRFAPNPSATLSRMGTPELVEHLQHWSTRTLDVFGRESLKPTLLAGVAMENLEGTLRRRLVALTEAGIKFERPPAEHGRRRCCASW